MERLNLRPDIEALLEFNGYEKLMEIQKMVLPHMRAGENIMAEAPTGSGKTLAYLLPMLERLNDDKKVKLLIIAPTKELGSQIVTEVRKFTESVLFLPDAVGRERQVENLKKKKPEILVGMANRIYELIVLGKIKVNHLQYIVIDEGDKVLTRDSKLYMEEILKSSLKSTPLAFFSATFRPVDQQTIAAYRPDIHPITSKEVTGKVGHYYLMGEERRKLENMFKVLRAMDSSKAIAFINRAEGVEGLKARIHEQSREIFILHTDLEMQQRKAVLEKFRKSRKALLITTDVFSRGLDIPDTDCVIHYDLPRTGNIYIHRSGRTGRGFSKGSVVSLVAEGEKSQFYDIRQMAKVHIAPIAFDRTGKLIFPKPRRDNHQK